MKIHILLLFLSFKAQAQAPLDIKSYLNNKQISKAAKDFYYGRFMPIDDTKTFSIIDSLETKNSLTRPFYILVVSKIIDQADGALSESLGISCKDFIESQPNYLIDFLYSKNKLNEKRFLGNWAHQIAMEFAIDCDEHRLRCAKASFKKASKKIRDDNKAKLISFYNKIERYSGS